MLILKDGMILDGWFKNGNNHGMIRQTQPNGDFCEFEAVNGIRTGYSVSLINET